MEGVETRNGTVRGWRAIGQADPRARCRGLIAAEGLFTPGCAGGASCLRIAEALRRERSRIGTPGYDLTRHWMLARAVESLRTGQTSRVGPIKGKGAARIRGDAL